MLFRGEEKQVAIWIIRSRKQLEMNLYLPILITRKTCILLVDRICLPYFMVLNPFIDSVASIPIAILAFMRMRVIAWGVVFVRGQQIG